MNLINGNGADATNAVPAETLTNNATDFIAEQAASPLNIPVSTPDQPDSGLSIPTTNQTTINWTEFADAKATRLTARTGTWAEMIERVRNVGTFDSKAKCPWLKLATFGNQRTEKRSLRHDANLLSVWGIEGDYDAELVTPEQAIDRLEQHGIRAAVYPSPSCTVEKPRWRVICPLSKQHSPDARAGLVARLNGALGDILAGESFTLSQSYYFGALETNDYCVLVTWDDPDDGHCVDELDELDAIAIGKAHKKLANPESTDGEPQESANDMDSWLDDLLSGDSVHPSACKIVASMIAKGVQDSMIRSIFSILAEKVEEKRGVERAAGLRDKELDDLISSAHNKGFDPEDPKAAFAKMKVMSEEATEDTIKEFVAQLAKLRKAGTISRAQEDMLLKPMAKRLNVTVKALRGDVFSEMGGYDESDHLEWARRLTGHMGFGNTLYTQTSFWTWGGRVWEPVDDRIVKQHTHNMLEAAEYPVTKGDVDCITDVFKTESFCTESVFNRNDWWTINVKNGTLDLRDGVWVLRGHCREDYLTTQLPVDYVEGAQCPRFQQFLDEVFDGDPDAAQKIQCVLEFIGYTLLATCRYEKFMLLIGSGANGKSVLLGVVEALVGHKFVAAVQPSQFENRFQRAHLHTKLANIVTEIAEGAEIADAQLKSIVSGELTTAEHKMRPPFDFRPFATCWFGTNHMPHTRDFSDALFRRAIVMTFNNKFEGPRCDPHLKDRLLEELPGILVAGLQAVAGVIARGGFAIPESSLAATREWRNESDQVAQFVEEACQLVAGESVTSTALYNAYSIWAVAAGIKKTLGRKNFTTRLIRLGLVADRGTGGIRMIYGIRSSTSAMFPPWARAA
jgi:putative DNA primase/helicase